MKPVRSLPAGFYGKIPSYGDFLHRQLPSGFVEPWNAWLAGSLAESRRTLGDRWMQAYLTSPPWRFVLEPGVVGEGGWLGILASSIDTVRRCYPIALAIALPEQTRLPWLADGVDALLDSVERIALEMIDGQATPDAAAARLDDCALKVAQIVTPTALFGRNGDERVMLGRPPSRLAGLALRWMAEAGLGSEDYPLSAWWHFDWSDRAPASLITPGMPSADIFSCFLDGGWADRGWTEQMGEQS